MKLSYNFGNPIFFCFDAIKFKKKKIWAVVFFNGGSTFFEIFKSIFSCITTIEIEKKQNLNNLFLVGGDSLTPLFFAQSFR